MPPCPTTPVTRHGPNRCGNGAPAAAEPATEATAETTSDCADPEPSREPTSRTSSASPTAARRACCSAGGRSARSLYKDSISAQRSGVTGDLHLTVEVITRNENLFL